MVFSIIRSFEWMGNSVLPTLGDLFYGVLVICSGFARDFLYIPGFA